MGVFDRALGSIAPGPTALIQRIIPSGWVLDPNATVNRQQSVTFDNVLITSPISWNLALGNHLILTLTSNAVYTLNAVTTSLIVGELVYLTVRNTIGGAAGAMTFGAAFKASAATQPATANSRSYIFSWNGVNLVEVAKSVADVPN